MKMKKIFYTVLITISIITLNSSCNFLDLKPVHSYVGSDNIKDYEDALAVVNGVYPTLLNEAFQGSQFVKLTSRSGFISVNSGSTYEELYKQEALPASSQANVNKFIWQPAYKGINYANFAIESINSLPEKEFEGTKFSKAQLIGEARLLRAWFYIHVLYNYCHWWADDSSPYGIVYRDKVSKLNNVEVPRSTIGESYAKIVEDLDYAIENSPTLDEYETNRKMSREYAKVLKLKLLLIRGASDDRVASSTTDFATARAIVDDLLANKPDRWVMEPDMKQMYENSFDSKENLFCSYNEDYSKGGVAGGGFTYAYGTGYISSTGNNEVLTSEGKPSPYHNPDNWDAGLNTKNLSWIKEDPRWNITFGVADNPENWDKGTRFMTIKLYRNGQYSDKKETHTTPIGAPTGASDKKWTVYYFRLYELYLLNAELILRTGGSATDALSVINQVRAQRTNPVLPALTASTTDEVYQIILKEIVNELYFENGSEFFASLRFKAPGGAKYIDYNKISEGINLNMSRTIYPLPSEELNPNKLAIQNPWN